MLNQLKEDVYNANIMLPQHGLVTLTWGNVSGFDPHTGLIVIKPSGVDYSKLKKEDMVVVDLEGRKVEGVYKPSSDTPTHCLLYKKFKNVFGIVHTHSLFATAHAQANMPIEVFGTTHADYFYGDIPVTEDMTVQEIHGKYEEETGNVIVEVFSKRNLAPLDIPAVLVKNHGPFIWGESPLKAVENAIVLEEIAKINYYTRSINPSTKKISRDLLDKHYLRKHGSNSYYGQN